MRVLVSAASRHGATGEIAAAIAAGLSGRGADAEARPLDEVGSLDGYDAVVLGSAIYMGHWLKRARTFVEAHEAELSDLPVWLFSSGPVGPPEHPFPEEECADGPELMHLIGGREHRLFAGRLERRSLGFAERAAANVVHAPEADSRDWHAIDEFAGDIADELLAARVAG
jgi:menaquinone-dependent protoporphyrinogen oxidase